MDYAKTGEGSRGITAFTCIVAQGEIEIGGRAQQSFSLSWVGIRG